jgi:acyl-CoA thioesterase-2
MRPVRLRPPMARDPRSAEQALWLRARDPLGDDPGLHRAALLYLSDYGLLGTAMLPYGFGYGDPEMQFASLDHSLWVHDEFRADDWLLFDLESPWAGSSRGLSRGLIFTRDGRHVATVAQEGLTRKISD